MCPLTKDKEKDKDYSWASNYEKKKHLDWLWKKKILEKKTLIDMKVQDLKVNYIHKSSKVNNFYV